MSINANVKFPENIFFLIKTNKDRGRYANWFWRLSRSQYCIEEQQLHMLQIPPLQDADRLCAIQLNISAAAEQSYYSELLCQAEYSSLLLGWLPNPKLVGTEPFLSLAWYSLGRRDGFMPFQRISGWKWNTNYLVQSLNSVGQVHFLRR